MPPRPSLLQRLWRDRFFRESSALLVLSNAAAAGNYIFQIAANRNLTKDEYGLLNALFSLSVLTGMVADIYGQHLIKAVGAVRRHPEAVSRVARRAFLPVLGLFVAVTGLSTALLWDRVGDRQWLWAIAALNLIHFFAVIPGALAQGLGRMRWSAVAGGVGVFLKLGAAVALAAAGWLHLGGALFAYGLGTLVGALLLAWAGRSRGERNDPGVPAVGDGPEAPRNAWVPLAGMALGVMSLNAFQSIDMPLARALLSAEASGEYATASVFGRTVFMLAAPLLPLVFVRVHHAFIDGRSDRAVMVKTAALVGLLAAGGWALFALLLAPFMRILNPAYGEEVRSLILLASLLSFPLLVLHYLSAWFMSVGRYGFFFVLAGSSGALWFLLRTGTPSVRGFLTERLALSVAAALLALLFFFAERRRMAARSPGPAA